MQRLHSGLGKALVFELVFCDPYFLTLSQKGEQG